MRGRVHITNIKATEGVALRDSTVNRSIDVVFHVSHANNSACCCSGEGPESKKGERRMIEGKTGEGSEGKRRQKALMEGKGPHFAT